uniref:Uncharacterized protein n=1 Tax=Anguilla anguilla TaxID=7936 RepID=A0A0E9VP21_ANGAN
MRRHQKAERKRWGSGSQLMPWPWYRRASRA